MMQPRYASLRDVPSPKREYVLDFSNLSGGINLWDPDYRLKSNESPEMKNLLWRNGMLCSRKGQYFLCPYQLGQGFAAYPRLWHGFIFAHIGGNIFRFDAERGSPVLLATGIPKIRGTFFTFSDKLYYKTKGAYKEITANQVDGQWSFSCSEVFPYEPVIVINANPATGAGDLYQPENRMSSRKTVWYNAVDGAKTYYLPVKAERVTYVEVNGYHVTSGWRYDPQAGEVLFDVAPPVTDPPTNNTVRITYELDNPEARKSISDCRYAAVYGGTGELCVVMAGSEDQPNAYFWSGNSSLKMDASYFPMEQVQLAGSSEERITGFGKQQDNLIIFKEGSVGKTTLGTQIINDRIFIDLPYIPINASIGCDLPWSIQLVENNLVFANRNGIYTILDTSSANENNIVGISRKINGSVERRGYLFDVGVRSQSEASGGVAREKSGASFACAPAGAMQASNRAEPGSWRVAGTPDATDSVLYPRLNEGTREASGEIGGGQGGAAVDEDEVCSCDDGTHYFLTANGKTWAWNYELSGWKDPSWFLLTNTNAVALICEAGEIYHLNGVGSVSGLQDQFNDYGEPIERLFRFPTMNFGSYDCRKNVNSVIVTLGAYELENTELWYLTDYETRKDLTNLQVVDAAEYDDERMVGTRPESTRVPAVFRRRPMCRRVLHFTMKLVNANLNEDFELVGAQIYYIIQGRLR
ncbi:MAG: hypothetical protein J6M64_09860 [Oscillospiraceae bacterium]|nr:hypothetical protein [Oscillospiraceae bacterium]